MLPPLPDLTGSPDKAREELARLAVAAHAVGPSSEASQVLDALKRAPQWLRLADIDNPDETPSLAEEAVLLAAVCGARLPLDAPPPIAATSIERSGHHVSADGRLVPSRALHLHFTGDAAAARAHLMSPSRLLSRVPNLLLRPNLPEPVRSALMAWLGSASNAVGDEEEGVLIRAAEADATPALRLHAVRQLMALDERTVHAAGFVRERRAEIEVLLGTLLDDALSPPGPDTALDHQARRHVAWFLGNPVPGAERSVIRTLLDSPYVGADVALLAERMRVHADRAGAAPDAPRGFGLTEDLARFDLLEVLAAIQDLPRPPPRELIDRIRSVIERIDVSPFGPSDLTPPKVRVALGAAHAIGDRGTWLAQLSVAARSSLIEWLTIGPVEAIKPLTGAVYAERASLSDKDRRVLAHAVRRWTQGRLTTMDADLCLLAIAALSELDQQEQEALLTAIAATPESWRLGLYRRVAEESQIPVIRSVVGGRLMSMVNDETIRQLNGPAAALLLALVRGGHLPDRMIADVLAILPVALRRHPRVAEELARVDRG